jgi:hypothetical protein
MEEALDFTNVLVLIAPGLIGGVLRVSFDSVMFREKSIRG